MVLITLRRCVVWIDEIEEIKEILRRKDVMLHADRFALGVARCTLTREEASMVLERST